MPETELIPRIDEDGLVKASSDLENLKLELAPLEQDIKKAVIKTDQEYEYVGALRGLVKENEKKGAWIIAPFESIAQSIKTRIQTMKLSHKNKCVELIGIADGKMSDWRTPEKKTAAEEKEKMDKQRAKQGLPPLKDVKPNIPTIPGMRVQTRYHAECVDFRKLLDAYRKGTPVQRAFLEQFLMPNDQQIGKHARETKDDDTVMKQIPGSRAWHTD